MGIRGKEKLLLLIKLHCKKQVITYICNLWLANHSMINLMHLEGVSRKALISCLTAYLLVGLFDHPRAKQALHKAPHRRLSVDLEVFSCHAALLRCPTKSNKNVGRCNGKLGCFETSSEICLRSFNTNFSAPEVHILSEGNQFLLHALFNCEFWVADL